MLSTTPTGSPRGYTWSPPEVSTCSPGWMRESAVRLPICTRPVSVPRRIARIRVVASTTPAPELGSLISSTSEVAGNTSRSLPTTPFCVITAMSGRSPSRDPLSMVSMCVCSLPLAPITCAATVDPT